MTDLSPTPIFNPQEHLNPYKMPSAESVNLSDYKDILIDHEQEYRQSVGSERHGILQDIIKEMATQSGGTLNEDTMKGLVKVSQSVQICNPEVSPS